MSTSREQYIEQYAEYAMEQMRKYGIPASITLAQGIIESADGKSMLARTANNHFGVKGEYNGQYVRADDDKPNEKFKKYENVGQSFEDHSKVLMAERYQKYCANLAPDDYRGWAEGIKAGGYATGKNYVNTIVNVIEGANLQKYDQMVMNEARQENQAKALYSLPLQREEFMLVSSPFGNRQDPMDASKAQFHKGIDIVCNNEPLLAMENNGKVINVNHDASTAGGKSVTIEYNREDGSKFQTTYMHMASVDVKVGDVVQAGEKMGVSGNTGTRTTGPHLHLEIKSIAADGSSRTIDPAAYIAEIVQKGGLQQQLLHNGKDLLVSYKTDNPEAQTTEMDTSMSPEAWMKKLLSSEDSGWGMSKMGDPIIEMATTLFTSLMALAIQIDNKSHEEKIQAVTEAAASKRIDLTGLLPNIKQCTLSVTDGRPLLEVDNGAVKFSHELSNAEMTRLQQTLANGNLMDDDKRRIVANIVNGIIISHQMTQNYQQGVDAQQELQESVQRR